MARTASRGKEPPPDALPLRGLMAPVQEIEAFAGDPDFMTSLARGLAVLRGFSQSRPHQTISQLSLRTGIPRAAVRRALHTLARLGYVGHDPDRKTFSLRAKVLTLGFAYLNTTPLTALAQPVLDAVSEKLHESSSMAVLEKDEVVYVVRSRTARRIMSVDLGVGSRLPAYCTSLGRVLLSGLSAPDLNAYLSRIDPVRHTQHTVVSREKLRAIVEAARKDEFAIIDQELEVGLRSIAVPVRDDQGRIVAAINAGTQVHRVSVPDLERLFLPVLREAAGDLCVPTRPLP
ncbi:Pca regulon regulatory protein [Usitatibacter rugosus]|uniref:Pca regulon regulatory protein n=1 Tax=Usitatibacter rugosus TaxID=2732067 RepID=A0A6M4GVX6_9PROT|nr:IclR family transcriptional regulator C-terminal domain-containing protein [Usitatibacter rugosus]QJR11440.1 Pca regulon regulatory protein [Usitatibacter rugosus]